MVNDAFRRQLHAVANAQHPYASALVPSDVEQAARSGDTTTVQKYLAGGANPNARTVYQSQLLHVAARHGQSDVLRLLLAAPGIDIMALDYGGMRRTALHWACQRGDVRSVEALVAAGANTTVQGKSWAKLVQGQRCGRLVQSDTPSEESPADLCRSSYVRSALLQPPWTPETHRDFPEPFRAAAQVLLLAAGCRSAPAEQLWPLSSDVTRSIIAMVAYPISDWLSLDGLQ